MKILDEYGIEIAIPSICKAGDVTHVVISRETERFVNEIHTHEARNQIQQGIARKFSAIQRKHALQTKRGNHSPTETWVASSTGETREGFLKLVPNKASSYSRKIIPRNEKEWITIHANPKRASDLAIFISKTVTSILRHFDQDERESERSRHWEGVKSVLLRKFQRDGVQNFSDEVWLQKIFEGSSKRRIELP